MGMQLDLFMRWWRGPGQISTGDYQVDGVLTYALLRHCRIVEDDIKQFMLDDEPFLADTVNKFDRIVHYQIWINMADLTEDFAAQQDDNTEYREFIEKGLAELRDKGEGRGEGDYVGDEWLMSEFTQCIIAGRMDEFDGVDEWTRDALLRACTRVATDNGVSILGGIDGVNSMTPDGRGGFNTERVIGRKVIDQEVEKFRAEMESSDWFGGGES